MKQIEDVFGHLPNDMAIRNPFSTDKITYIALRMRRRLFSDKFEFVATIQFKNGNTSGEHEINGSDFGDLFNKVIAFCKEL